MKPIAFILVLALTSTACSDPANRPSKDPSNSGVTSPPASLNLPGTDNPLSSERPRQPQTRGKIISVLVTSDCMLRDQVTFEPRYEDWDSSSAQPFSFKDPRTDVTFYVESDGRHLAAIDSSGRILWVRNPFEDAELCHYRTPRPVIARIEAIELPPDHAKSYVDLALPELKRLGMDFAKHRFLRVHFDSSQYGIVDETSGNFFFEGQN
jgi:hypothetical protein